jgi:hypothetical protein
MESNDDSKVDCQVSEWSEWSECENCRGYTISTRHITVLLRILQYRKREKDTMSQLQIELFPQVTAKDGGKSCPKKLLRRKKCHRTQQCCEYLSLFLCTHIYSSSLSLLLQRDLPFRITLPLIESV